MTIAACGFSKNNSVEGLTLTFVNKNRSEMQTTTRTETPAGTGKSSVDPDALNQLLHL
jgi:hypothetical protein